MRLTGKDEQMGNLILFLNSFFSYLLLFILIAVLVVVACITWWPSPPLQRGKSKDQKLALSGGGEAEQTAGGEQA